MKLSVTVTKIMLITAAALLAAAGIQAQGALQIGVPDGHAYWNNGDSITAGAADHPWPMFRHDLKHTGRSPFVGPQTADVKWVYPTGDAIRSSPAIAEDGTIYVGCNDGNLYAINPDGTYKWSYPMGGNIYSSPAIGSDGTIYIASWRENGLCTGAVYAINPDSTLKWRYPNTGYLSLSIESSPAIDPLSGVVYVGGTCGSPWAGRMHAINPDGSWKWEFNPGGSGWVDASPAINDSGKIIFGDYSNPDGIIWALNPEDGSVHDSEQIPNPGGEIDIRSSVAIDSDGMIYFGGGDGDANVRLWALNPDLTVAWSFPTGSRVPGSPAIGLDGTIYIGSYDDKLYAINPDGTQKWSFTTGGNIYSSPAVGADGTIYFGATDGTFYAVNPNHSLKWSYTTGGAIYSSPAISSDGTMYVGSYDGYLYAFEAPTSLPIILCTSPWQNELNVPINSNISVRFSVDMDETTINNSTFVVHARSTGLHQGTITYDGPSRTATLDPFQDFAVGEVVTVVLTTGIQLSEGPPLDSSYVWSFTILADNGPGTFDTVLAYEAGYQPMAVCAADFDGNGSIDLATANFDSDDISVLLNNGDGSFASPWDYPVLADPGSIYAVDLDADGDVDIITGSEAAHDVSVLLNYGDGTFGGYYVYAVEGHSYSVFAADLDGDADLDLITACPMSSNVSVLLNYGDGSFAPYSSYEVGTGSFSVFGADFDSDGDIDLATANRDSDSVSVLLNDGSGDFAPHSLYEVGSGPTSIYAADLDIDGDLDLTTANGNSDNASVLLNNGDGTFGSRSDYPVGGNEAASAFIADLDGDGDLDLVTANWNSHDVSVLRNYGDGTLAPCSVYPVVGYNPRSTCAADLDGDGDLDLAVATTGSDSVTVLLNWIPPPNILYVSPSQNELNVPVSTNISVTFDTDMNEATINNSTFVVHARSTGLHQGTITYDGPSRTATLDPFEDFDVGEVVTVTLTTGIRSSGGAPLDSSYVWSFTILAYDGTGTFVVDAVYAVIEDPTSVFAADLDGYDGLDLAVANWTSDSVSVLLNNGNGTFGPQSGYEVGYSPGIVIAADLDGDGDLDLAAIKNGSSDNVSILLNNGDGTFGSHQEYPVGNEPKSLFAADLDGDGDLDLTTANMDSDSISVLLNNGDATFAPQAMYEVGDGPLSVFAADLDGDADLDLAVANHDSDSISVLFNYGDGTFASQSMYEVGDGPGSVFAADLDDDGDLDLVATNSWANSISVLFNYGDGTFSAPSNYPVGNYPVSLFAADLDGDDDLDLAIVNNAYDFHNVSVLLNNGNGTFADHSVYPVGGYPWGMFAADLDGDGDIDLAVGCTACSGADSVWVLLNQDFTCGDVAGNGGVNLYDLNYLLNYLWNDGPAPPIYEQADMDDYKVVTWSDLAHLFDFLFIGGPPPDCDLDHEKLSGPVDSNNYLELVEIAFPANETSMTLHFNLNTSVSLSMGNLTIRIRVDGQVPTVTNCQHTSLLDPFNLVNDCKIDADSGKVLFSFAGGSAGPLSGEMATVDIGMPASGAARLITVEWDPFPPVYHDPPEYDNEYSHYPLFVEASKTSWTPALIVHPCCIGIRGNVDLDPGDAVNVADLAYLVSFLFDQPPGPAPPCFEEGDVDASLSINVADLAYLVSYLFDQPPGPAPAPCP